MAVEVILPMLGETMDKGTIVKWYVDTGQRVRRGEPIYEIETDKAVLEVEAPADGVLRRIFHGAGSTVPVLAMVGLIADADEDISAYEASQLGSSQEPSQRVDAARVAQAHAEPAASSRVRASPRARKLAAKHKVDLARVDGTGPGGRVVERDVRTYVAAQPPATPVARKMAQEAHLDLSAVRGTGPGGRVTRADVQAELARAAPAEREPKPPSLPLAEKSFPLTGLRRIIAERMSTSAHTTARVTLTTEVDATELVRLRTLLKEQLEPSLGFAISYTDILVAVVARALGEYPYMNVRLTDEGIQALPTINVGVAVDTERGLLVTVIRDADAKGIGEIASALRELVARAREGKSMPDDLSGGSITITNLGMYGVDAFTPIINLPECAILGVGRLCAKPTVHEGQICARDMVVLSLTFDHRLVDGAPAARFLQRVGELAREPYVLLEWKRLAA